MRRVLSAVLTGVLAASAVSPEAHAQQLPRITLSPANSTLVDDFVRIGSLRELSNGQVLLTDARDQQIYLADFTTRRAQPLSRKGKGPLEYSMLGDLHAIAGDSTVMSDLANARWLLFAGPRVVGTLPPDHPAVKASSPLRGADARGHVLALKSETFTSGVRLFTRKDSIAVLLVDRKTGRADTVARAREMPRQASMTVDAEGKVTSSSTMATESGASPEEVFLAADGAVAIVRLRAARRENCAQATFTTRRAVHSVHHRESSRHDRWRDHARCE